MPNRKARRLTPDQLAALARGRALIAANRARREAVAMESDSTPLESVSNSTGKFYEPPLGSVHVDDIGGEQLRAYARRAGVLPRDVDNLSEDRLRQNVKIVIANHFELIEEG